MHLYTEDDQPNRKNPQTASVTHKYDFPLNSNMEVYTQNEITLIKDSLTPTTVLDFFRQHDLTTETLDLVFLTFQIKEMCFV